jgi:hypothetical protein
METHASTVASSLGTASTKHLIESTKLLNIGKDRERAALSFIHRKRNRKITMPRARPQLSFKRMVMFGMACLAAFNGCASTQKTEYRLGTDIPAPETVEVDSGAYGSDHFTFGKRMPIRPANDFVFFFKHCELIKRRPIDVPFYLHAEYGCTPPP